MYLCDVVKEENFSLKDYITFYNELSNQKLFQTMLWFFIGVILLIIVLSNEDLRDGCLGCLGALIGVLIFIIIFIGVAIYLGGWLLESLGVEMSSISNF